MAQKININLKNLPKPVRIILAAAPSVLLIVLMVFLVILPKSKEIERIKVEIAEQEKKIAKTQSMAGRLEDLIAENERLRKRLKELEEFLPEEKEISSLLKQVEGLTIEAGLDILAWNPASKRQHPSGVVFEIPVMVTLKGSYHRLGQFFSSLTRLERIVNISDIALGNPEIVGKEVILGVSFSAVTFTTTTEGGLSE
jgi:type IV pilus assembly protein PilO